MIATGIAAKSIHIKYSFGLIAASWIPFCSHILGLAEVLLWSHLQVLLNSWFQPIPSLIIIVIIIIMSSLLSSPPCLVISSTVGLLFILLPIFFLLLLKIPPSIELKHIIIFFIEDHHYVCGEDVLTPNKGNQALVTITSCFWQTAASYAYCRPSCEMSGTILVARMRRTRRGRRRRRTRRRMALVTMMPPLPLSSFTGCAGDGASSRNNSSGEAFNHQLSFKKQFRDAAKKKKNGKCRNCWLPHPSNHLESLAWFYIKNSHVAAVSIGLHNKIGNWVDIFPGFVLDNV